jgi:multidrug efflux pump subunit AcrB
MQLPGGAALDRTTAVNRRVSELALQVPGVVHAVNLVRLFRRDLHQRANSGTIFVGLAPFSERVKDPAQSAPAIQRALQQKLSVIEEALVSSSCRRRCAASARRAASA